MANMLEIQNLSINYGAIEALKDVSLSVAEGSIVAILGANGAGKSTLLKTISGLVKPKSGKIILNGTTVINGLTPYKIAALGVIQSPEGRLILQGLTTEENLRVGTYAIKGAQGGLRGQFTMRPWGRSQGRSGDSRKGSVRGSKGSAREKRQRGSGSEGPSGNTTASSGSCQR